MYIGETSRPSDNLSDVQMMFIVARHLSGNLSNLHMMFFEADPFSYNLSDLQMMFLETSRLFDNLSDVQMVFFVNLFYTNTMNHDCRKRAISFWHLCFFLSLSLSWVA